MTQSVLSGFIGLFGDSGSGASGVGGGGGAAARKSIPSEEIEQLKQLWQESKANLEACVQKLEQATSPYNPGKKGEEPECGNYWKLYNERDQLIKELANLERTIIAEEDKVQPPLAQEKRFPVWFSNFA